MQHHVVYVAASHAAAASSARVVAATIAVSSVRVHSVTVAPTCSSASPAIDVYRHTATRTLSGLHQTTTQATHQN